MITWLSRRKLESDSDSLSLIRKIALTLLELAASICPSNWSEILLGWTAS
jgi:hypothetical protein